MSKALKPLNTLRKSLPNSSKGSGGGPTFSLQPKSPEIMNPPKKVIKALYDYTAESPEELTFVKGDFFMVVANENDEFWYLASNPNTGARGLVPVSYFQIVSKRRESSPAPPSLSQMASSHNQMAHMIHPVPHNPAVNGYGHAGPARTASPMQQPPSQSRPHTPGESARRNSRARSTQPQIYGTVLYDFDAERPDELAAKAGDHVIIIAQSNEDWFVAKPINRIGGPGLLPVSFIQVRDLKTGQPVTNLLEMLRNNNIKLPGVAEWKREAIEQDRQHIPLGVVAGAPPQTGHGPSMVQPHPSGPNSMAPSAQRASRASVGSAGSHPGPGYSGSAARQPSFDASEYNQRNSRAHTAGEAYSFLGENVAGISVVSYKNKGDRFYFQIQMLFRDGHQRILFRLYEEFYQFQVYLLEEFPKEAGRMDEPRTLPFMTGPLSFVNETITAERRAQLDEYLRNLFRQPSYIVNSAPIQNFLAPRGEDLEIAAPSTVQNLHVQPLPPHHGSSPPREERYRSGGSSVSASNTLIGEQRISSPSHEVYARDSAAAYGGGSAQQRLPGPPRSRSGSETTAHNHPDAPLLSGSPTDRGTVARPVGQPPSGEIAAAAVTAAIAGAATTASATGASIKVKVMYNDDLVAMRITLPMTLTILQERIGDRLNIHVGSLEYRDSDGEFIAIHSEEDLQDVLADESNRTRLVVRVTSL
ncbi:bud emergence protein 1 [Tieghemiomyces parasiticus]|uniref:Bud emergence protein 1 n=1 Tax=Tieghemiomyces parasiticus TaxID=78921 RepID=A0A9W8E221_9FUNG|nr:bud emergence protein 1 [Tieghemiomyces parasiticus]